MFRSATIGLLCLAFLVGKPLNGSDKHAPWVSCFSKSGEHWEGGKTFRTPTTISSDGKLKAYAQIRASVSAPRTCENTVRLFVSTQDSVGFHQVFMQKPSALGGTANSLAPNSWSPDQRWLLVEFGNWFYGSDAGGIDLMLYDNKAGKIVSPDLTRMIKVTLKRECSIRLIKIIGFDASSRVRLELAEDTDEGEDQPRTHCFHGTEEWAMDPQNETMQPVQTRP
jgi:hypothetical protein